MDTWTISELAERAAAALADLEVNGRVQDVPNERLIRWYATLGLLDPPLRQGRTARYTGRHLLQLVAVKRRQAAGRTLAEIQAELTGAPSETLLAITGPFPGLRTPPPAAPPSPVRRFWAAVPSDATTAPGPSQSTPSGGRPATGTGKADAAARALGAADIVDRKAGAVGAADGAPGSGSTDEATDTVDETTGTSGAADTEGGVSGAGEAPDASDPGAGSGTEVSDGGSGSDGASEAASPDIRWTAAVELSGKPETSDVRIVAMQGVLLAPGVTLLLETSALDGEDLAALRAAAEPLLRELAERGLPAATARREGELHL
ncbi:MerR family transcriptional regulator [Actinocorallia populi]|uniref:MerR family transcriptional regulator n=1 Tax=Actinocorallia populi TaxID=2079200 RepID=UPI001E38826A|nr:MerR family transcriptional regulator [Actinocorallia populi]